MGLRLNLGAADRHLDSFLCVDIAPPPCEVCDAIADPLGVYAHEGVKTRRMDLSKTWNLYTHSVDEIVCFDCIEHIADRIHFMNELHRVLIPGGRATIETPNAARGVGYFQDPTHVSPFCLSTFKYFEHGAFAHQRLAKAYGITAAFRMLELSESRSNGEDPGEEVWKIRAVMEAVK